MPSDARSIMMPNSPMQPTALRVAADRQRRWADPSQSMENLPEFRYHPDPVATGSIVPSDDKCGCCGKLRGYKYASVVYCVDEVETVCPWCIADGSLAAKFDASLIDDHSLQSAGLPSAVVEEVTARTPGYVSWQQSSWMSCCGDACEFHGDAPRAELQALDDVGLQRLANDSGVPVATLRKILSGYQPGGSPAFYKFVCRHCRETRYNVDCD